MTESKNDKISTSMLGNKNAEIWTYEESEKLLIDAIILSNEKETFTIKNGEKAFEVYGYKFDFIGEIARELDTYHSNITRDIPTRHPKLKMLVDKLIYNLEANCYSNTKKGIIKEATGIVNLKSNHKWTDRTDLTTKDKEIKNKDLSEYSTEELIKRAESIRKING